MPTAADVLGQIARQVEEMLEVRLKGLGGAVVRTQLPQTWSFRLGQEEFTFVVDRWGKIQTTPGFLPTADVKVETTLERLMATLHSGTKGETPPATMGITFGSPRGRRAYFYVRKQLKI